MRNLSKQDLQPILVIWDNLVQLQMFQPTKHSTWNPVAVGSIWNLHLFIFLLAYSVYELSHLKYCLMLTILFAAGHFWLAILLLNKEKQKPQLPSHHKLKSFPWLIQNYLEIEMGIPIQIGRITILCNMNVKCKSVEIKMFF